MTTPPIAAPTNRQPAVLVTGDVIVDCHLYQREQVGSLDEVPRGLRACDEFGGAALTHRLIERAFRVEEAQAPTARANDDADAVAPGITSPKAAGPWPSAEIAFDLDNAANGVYGADPRFWGYAVWRQFARSSADSSKVWRVDSALGYMDDEASGGATISACPWPVVPWTAPDPPRVLVIDDSDRGFRHSDYRNAWCLPVKRAKPVPREPGVIVLKLAGRLGAGELWHELQELEPLRARLVILVAAQTLRNAGLRLSRGLSWERTSEHLISALFAGSHPLGTELTKCRHIIVTFGHDAAIWADIPRESARMVFDPANVEGEWPRNAGGGAFAYQTCMAAALARAFARHPTGLAPAPDGSEPQILDALERGLSAMRLLRMDGHGMAKGGTFPAAAGFPSEALANEIVSPSYAFTRADVPIASATTPPASPASPPWSILSASVNPVRPGPLYGPARNIVRDGEKFVKTVPHLRIGKLLSVDRAEMEAIRSVRRIMDRYRDPRVSGKKPLSIGVFGQPGSGKSFGVKELAKAVFAKNPDVEDEEYEGWMEFNLSQFVGPADLIGAFHQVRDRVLQGIIPVVLWDEFDSRELYWLQYLLAPMQDGRFQGNQLTHTLGKCVFVFAGGTAFTFEDFDPHRSEAAAVALATSKDSHNTSESSGNTSQNESEASRKFRLAKGPDFQSRLDGYLNVTGPNPIGPSDFFFPIRRAVLIRGILRCGKDERLDIDPGLVRALVEVKKYENGARSLEKVLEPFQTAKGDRRRPLRRWQLPTPNQMRQHVTYDDFNALCDKDFI